WGGHRLDFEGDHLSPRRFLGSAGERQGRQHGADNECSDHESPLWQEKGKRMKTGNQSISATRAVNARSGGASGRRSSMPVGLGRSSSPTPGRDRRMSDPSGVGLGGPGDVGATVSGGASGSGVEAARGHSTTRVNT